jgi:hypothetical protein
MLLRVVLRSLGRLEARAPYLGRACRSGDVLPGWLGVIAFVGAASLVAMIVVSQLSGADALNNLLSLAIGMVVAPIVTIGLGVTSPMRRAVPPHLSMGGRRGSRTSALSCRVWVVQTPPP